MKEGIKLAQKDIKAARDIMLKTQDYKCLLCGLDFRTMKVRGRRRVPVSTPVLDHCHEHGFVRGVICNTCNGKFGEGKVRQAAKACSRTLTEAEWLMNLAEYWAKHETPQTKYIHPTHKTEDEKRLARNKRERLRRARAKAAAELKG